MRLAWYSRFGQLLDTRHPESLSYGVKLAKKLSRGSGFCCLEFDRHKLRWWKKGKEHKT